MTRRAPATAARAASGAGGGARLAPLVDAELRRHGYPTPGAEIVDTIAAVGAGYRKGPAADPPFRIAIDADGMVATALVERYVTGDRSTLIDLVMHRRTVRSAVDQNLELLGVAGVGDVGRETLTSLSLGSWNPATEEHARRNAVPGFIVALYKQGLA